MSVPRNTTSLLEKLKKAPAPKKSAPVVEKKEQPETETDNSGAASAGREAAKLRQRAKKAETDLATITGERDTLKAEVETLRGPAKKWNDYEHIEKSKLLESLPPELKKDAKDMPLHHLRMFAKGSTTTAEKKADDSKVTDSTDIFTLQKSGDKKAINEYMAKVKAGEIIPAQPKAESAAA